jgi:predicted HicB family RNase H-like nuclease
MPDKAPQSTASLGDANTKKFGERVNYPLRLPADLHDQVMRKAKRQGMTLSSYLTNLIRKDVEKEG